MKTWTDMNWAIFVNSHAEGTINHQPSVSLFHYSVIHINMNLNIISFHKSQPAYD